MRSEPILVHQPNGRWNEVRDLNSPLMSTAESDRPLVLPDGVRMRLVRNGGMRLEFLAPREMIKTALSQARLVGANAEALRDLHFEQIAELVHTRQVTLEELKQATLRVTSGPTIQFTLEVVTTHVPWLSNSPVTLSWLLEYEVRR